MNNTTTTEVLDTCSTCGAYDLPIEVLNGKPVCEECADEALDITPVTGDVIAWLDVNYPEGDVAVVHTADCDRVSGGDECVGGCAVVFA